jgi:LysM repeat protein
MKKLTCIACALCLVLLGKAQKEIVAAYIATYKELAIKEMIRSGVPASITLAQGILETEAGQSALVKSSNNHFGIKCKTEWTGGKVYHDDDEKGECFRVYISAEESYRDHSDFLKNRSPYAFLFQLDPTNYEGWAKGLRKAGYATNPAYSQMLVKIIVDNNLQQYTLLALNRPAGSEQQEDIFAASNTTPADAPAVTPAGLNSMQAAATRNEAAAETTQPAATPVRTIATRTSLPAKNAPVNKPAAPVVYPAGLCKINETSVVYASAGTSLFAMANNYNVTYKKLLEFNELEETDIIENPQLVFLEKKPKKGSKDFHVVASEETIEQIAQAEGVRLESLLLYNHLVKGKQPGTGEKIYLRSNAPVATVKNTR